MAQTTEEKNTGIVLEVFKTFESLDLDAIIEYIHDDCYYRNMPFPFFTAAKDKTGIIKQIKFQFKYMSVYRVAKYLEVSAHGNHVTVNRIEHVRIFGVSMALHVKAVVEIKDGKVIEWKDYFSMKRAVAAFLKGIFKPAFRERIIA